MSVPTQAATAARRRYPSQSYSPPTAPRPCGGSSRGYHGIGDEARIADPLSSRYPPFPTSAAARSTRKGVNLSLDSFRDQPSSVLPEWGAAVFSLWDLIVIYVSAASAYVYLYCADKASKMPCARRRKPLEVENLTKSDWSGMFKSRAASAQSTTAAAGDSSADCSPPHAGPGRSPAEEVLGQRTTTQLPPKPPVGSGAAAGAAQRGGQVGEPSTSGGSRQPITSASTPSLPQYGGVITTTAASTPCTGNSQQTSQQPRPAALPDSGAPGAAEPDRSTNIAGSCSDSQRSASIQQSGCAPPNSLPGVNGPGAIPRPRLGSMVPRPPGSASGLKNQRRAQSVLVGTAATAGEFGESVPLVLEHLRLAIARKQPRSVVGLLEDITCDVERASLVFGRIGCDDRGFTLIHHAAVAGSGDVLEVLVKSLDQSERKIAVNATGTTANNYTSLHMAALKGDVAACKVLLAYGADPNCVSKLNATPLHLACSKNHVTAASLLLASGADANICTQTGNTALMSAVHNRSLDLVKLLIDAHANPRATTSDGNNALTLALGLNATDILEILEAAVKQHGHRRVASGAGPPIASGGSLPQGVRCGTGTSSSSAGSFTSTHRESPRLKDLPSPSPGIFVKGDGGNASGRSIS